MMLRVIVVFLFTVFIVIIITKFKGDDGYHWYDMGRRTASCEKGPDNMTCDFEEVAFESIC